MKVETANSQAANQSLTQNNELKDSIATIINTLTGSTLEGKNLANETLSEDVLYASLVHQQLRKENPELADQLQKTLKATYEKKVSKRERQPLSRTVTELLDKAVKNKKLTMQRNTTIKSLAFGKAQLDNDRTTLRREVTDPLQGTNATQANSVESTLERITANKSARRADISIFEKRNKTHPILSKRIAERQKNVLADIFAKSGSREPSKTSSTTATDSSTNNVQGTKGTDKPSLNPTDITPETGANHFVYNPKSTKDGNALVMIPISFADQVKGVSIFKDDQGKEKISDFKFSGKGEDGRDYFRNSKSGNDLTEGKFIYLTFVDDSVYKIKIDANNKWFDKWYA